MQISFIAPSGAVAVPLEALAAPVFEGKVLSSGAAALDGAGAISRGLSVGRFTGGKGQAIDLAAPAGLEADRLFLSGAGPDGGFDRAGAEAFGAGAYAALKASGATTLTLRLEGFSPDLAAQAAFGAGLAAYRFDRYRTTEKPEKKPSLTAVRVVTDDPQAAEAAYAPLSALHDAIVFSRDLVSEPANILYPAEFARRVQELSRLGLEIEVLGEAEMEKLGMGSLLGVGQGSRRESQLVVAKWNGGRADAAPLVIVGKGVTFDTGGISIKPADGMEDMKWDMGGAAAAIGALHAIAGRKAKANVIGVLGLVENMPDGNAQRPGDIVTSMSGQTIEVINTDAEGRLVLADALWYAKERFKPALMIDLATLTGAIIIALGNDYAGLFSNDDELALRIAKAGEAEGELVWRLPLPAAYEKQIESAAADMKNVGGRPAGSVTAALFLQKFVGKVPWAHLDIAGVAWRKGSTSPSVPDGAAGYGVRLLNRFVAEHYEA